MLDYRTTLITELATATGLPVHYELFVDSSTTKPCITYQQINDYDVAIGDTLQYSEITYSLKLWGSTLSTLVPYLGLMDKEMKKNGFKRTSYNELALDNELCLICNYKGMAQENETL